MISVDCHIQTRAKNFRPHMCQASIQDFVQMRKLKEKPILNMLDLPMAQSLAENIIWSHF